MITEILGRHHDQEFPSRKAEIVPEYAKSAGGAVLRKGRVPPEPFGERRVHYLARESLSRNTFVAVGITPKLSTARKIASIRRVRAAHAGGMTQNLSAGVSGPHAAPDAGTTGGVQSSPPAAETPASHETQTDREAPIG